MKCGSCEREPVHGDVTYGMQPGRDGQPWHLCHACYAPAPPAIGKVARPVAVRRQAAARGGLL